MADLGLMRSGVTEGSASGADRSDADRSDHARAWRRLRRVAIALAVTLALIWLALAFGTFRGPGTGGADPDIPPDAPVSGSAAWAYDFEAYLEAAQRLQVTGTPYQAETLAGPFRPGPRGLYLYSPVLAVALLPVADTGSEPSAVLWYLLHVLALAGAAALMPVQPLLRLAAFAVAAFSFAVVKDMGLGNVSVLLLLPMVVAWRWVDRPLGAAGLAVAMAVRPTLGILLVWQLLRRQWRAVAWTVAGGLVLVLVTLPFVGLTGYLDYLTVLRNMSDVTGVPHNHDISSMLAGLGVGEDIASLALLACYGIAVGAVLVAPRRDREVGFMVALTASLLLSPLLWDHYLATLLLPAAFLAQRWTPLALVIALLSWAPGGLFVVIILGVLALLLMAPSAVADRDARDQSTVADRTLRLAGT